jgi:hypothetical protein
MLLSTLNLLTTAPGGVARLRELILTLAVQGKLVAQDPKDEPASELLKKIRAEKDRLIAEGKIKRDKPLAEIAEEEKPFDLPSGWEWVRLNASASENWRGQHAAWRQGSLRSLRREVFALAKRLRRRTAPRWGRVHQASNACKDGWHSCGCQRPTVQHYGCLDRSMRQLCQAISMKPTSANMSPSSAQCFQR